MTETSLFSTFARADLAFERGEGVWLETASGERYLDMMAGIAVNALGHCHPHLVAALKDQAEKLWHVSNVFAAPHQERLARRLTETSFADRVFFTNSGAEALECAIKTARRWQWSKGRPERYRLITFEGAFHGRTLATIAAGGQEKYLEGFGPKVEGFDSVEGFDEAAVLAAIGPETAGILIEPIQGEGGVRPAPASFLSWLRNLCDELDLLLIFDEVQCGLGRTGHLWAYQSVGVTPDILASAKGIGGGFPLGACLATEDAASGMTAGTHGTTYGGNQLAMAVGNAVLDVVLAPGFLDEVKQKGLKLKQKLASLVDLHDGIFEEVRGDGLLLGLKCRVPAARAVAAMRESKLLTVGAGDNVVRFLPALVVGDAEIDEAVARVEAAAHALESGYGLGEKGAAA
ncbi:aspartate aminotransferase family protein [Pinisolibacter sp.]|uniref:aspartate aminotransferase family protein n=1 Tax=Pinisolibacter sp. TaxID=2172024 RepID=UPI002FDEABED